MSYMESFSKLKMFFKLLIFVAAIETNVCFNIDFRTPSANYLTSPLVKAVGRTPQGSPIPQLRPNTPPSYYGYKLNVVKSKNGIPRLTIGSPKMVNPENLNEQTKKNQRENGTRGSIESCMIKRNLFSGGSVSCSPAYPPDSLPGDGFGSSIAASPSGEMSGCSPTRGQTCISSKYMPGFCYKSSNFGQTWTMDGNTKSMGCPDNTVDVLFVLDGSGSVQGEFSTVKSWVKDITRMLRIDRRLVRVGIVQYSHYWEHQNIQEQHWIKTEIPIGKYFNYTKFSIAVNSIRLQNYTTYTAHALEKVLYDFQNSERFGHPSHKQVMLLLTDGKSDDADLIPENAKKVRDLGVTTFAIGVGSAKTNELRQIATGDPNSDKRVYSVRHFKDLAKIVEKLQTKILSFVLEGGGFKMENAETGFSSAYSKQPFVSDVIE